MKVVNNLTNITNYRTDREILKINITNILALFERKCSLVCYCSLGVRIKYK